MSGNEWAKTEWVGDYWEEWKEWKACDVGMFQKTVYVSEERKKRKEWKNGRREGMPVLPFLPSFHSAHRAIPSLYR